MLYFMMKQVCTLGGCITGGDEYHRPVAKLEMGTITQNDDGDVEGYVIGGLVGRAAHKINVIGYCIIYDEVGTLIRCVTGGDEDRRPAAQFEMGTITKKVDGDVKG